MPLVQWFRARSLSTSVVLGLLTPVGAAVAQPDPAQAVVAPVALPAVTSDTASVPAPSAVSAPLPTDSVHLIALLLTTNGASRERAGPAAAAIMKYARLHALDPLLVVGVIGVENASLKPRARSRVGARGVMQVMPSWRRDIRTCGDDLGLIQVNVCFGTRILRIALDQSTSVREALLRYNGCVRSPGCHKYADAVFSWAGRALLLSRASAPVVTPSAAAPSTPARATLAAGAVDMR
jgi:soluble lytic murein transglycosylase-like protein